MDEKKLRALQAQLALEQARPSLLGALSDPQFYRDIGGGLSNTLMSGLQDILPKGTGSPQIASTFGTPIDPQYRDKINNLALAGLTVYHGSPYKFDKFDMSKVGTGEGAQAYGHGLYMAENPNVAKEYAKNVAGNTGGIVPGGSVATNSAKPRINPSEFATYVDDGLHTEYGEVGKHLFEYTQNLKSSGINKALKSVEYPAYKAQLGSLLKAMYPDGSIPVSHIQGYAGYGEGAAPFTSVSINQGWGEASAKAGRKVTQFTVKVDDVLAAGNGTEGELIIKGRSPSANLYKVDLPDEHIAKMLDWDKPLSQQPDVLKMVYDKGLNHSLRRIDSVKDIGTFTGSDLVNALGKGEKATLRLKELGIPGIRYLDGGSRSSGKGTSNFVVFDDQLPKIIGKE